MLTTRLLLIILLVSLPLHNGLADSTARAYLIPELEQLRPFLGTTYRAEFDGENQKKLVDIARWERALNGTAVRILHSINKGEYGGESIIFYDKTQQTLRFYYFTTAGFYTEGRSHFEDGKLISIETVKGNQDGITQVISTASLSPSGVLTMSSAFKKGQEIASTHTVHYTPVENQTPTFK